MFDDWYAKDEAMAADDEEDEEEPSADGYELKYAE